MEAVLKSKGAASALVVFSGGQDLTTCLAWALSRFERVDTIGFDYGQRHAVELEARQNILGRIPVDFLHWSAGLGSDHVVKLDLLGELGRDRIGVPSSVQVNTSESFATGRKYIPGRNLLLLSMSAVVAIRKGIENLVCGVSEAEYSGYPDCTSVAVKLMQDAINASMGSEITVHTPLMHLDKAGVWRLAQQLGGQHFLQLIVDDTHTCYAGVRNMDHPWGKGCGECNACKLRSKGYAEFTISRHAST